MAETPPHEIVKGLLQGIAPPRPLFLPIVFSHGARIENMPLRDFLANPTKISNSLRQVRARLRSDGVTCYFDPYLEVEALGGIIKPGPEGQQPSLSLPPHVTRGEWPEESRPLAESAKGGRIAIAIEVIRRLKSILRDQCLLMASVSGPFTLAALLAQIDGRDAVRSADIPPPALELATAIIAPVATALLEAGANVIFIREDVIPALSPEEAADWASRLATTINVVRFYQALPILLVTRKESVTSNHDALFRQSWDCVICPVLDGIVSERPEAISALGPAQFGIALPPEAFGANSPGGGFDENLRRLVSDLRPAIITTAGDVPAAADMERLNKVWENVR